MPERILRLLEPLAEFYEASGQRIPSIALVAGDTIPEPYRSLLVHRQDMTPTLEAFAGEDLRIEVLNHREVNDELHREVVLVTRSKRRPVEFGAIRIQLGSFTAPVRQVILAGSIPLGRILQDHAVPHTAQADAFFRCTSDGVINQALGLDHSQTLFGRHGVLVFKDGRPLAEAVEILPPLAEA